MYVAGVIFLTIGVLLLLEGLLIITLSDQMRKWLVNVFKNAKKTRKIGFIEIIIAIIFIVIGILKIYMKW